MSTSLARSVYCTHYLKSSESCGASIREDTHEEELVGETTMVQLTVADYRSAIYGRYLQLKPKKGELESLVPSLTLWVVVATYVSCRIIAVIKGTYFGGLSWPFLRWDSNIHALESTVHRF